MYFRIKGEGEIYIAGGKSRSSPEISVQDRKISNVVNWGKVIIYQGKAVIIRRFRSNAPDVKRWRGMWCERRWMDLDSYGIIVTCVYVLCCFNLVVINSN